VNADAEELSMDRPGETLEKAVLVPRWTVRIVSYLQRQAAH
jgi:hypothetical protein